MAPEKVTEMVLNVDLKCSGCYKKVKKVIRKIPQIRDQVFEMEKNKVKVVVVCCSPEKIRDKICYKGGRSIQSIEIVEKPDKPKVAAPAADKTKDSEKAKPTGDKPKEPQKTKAAAEKPKGQEKPKQAAADKPKDAGKPKEPEKAKPADQPKDAGNPNEAAKPALPKEAPKKPDAGGNPEVAKMVYEPAHGYPHVYPSSTYPLLGYGHHYDQGYGGLSYQHGYGMPVAPPPPPSYGGFGYEDGFCGYNDGSRNLYTSYEYVDEEDGEGCSIM